MNRYNFCDKPPWIYQGKYSWKIYSLENNRTIGLVEFSKPIGLTDFCLVNDKELTEKQRKAFVISCNRWYETTVILYKDLYKRTKQKQSKKLNQIIASLL